MGFSIVVIGKSCQANVDYQLLDTFYKEILSLYAIQHSTTALSYSKCCGGVWSFYSTSINIIGWELKHISLEEIKRKRCLLINDRNWEMVSSSPFLFFILFSLINHSVCLHEDCPPIAIQVIWKKNSWGIKIMTITM